MWSFRRFLYIVFLALSALAFLAPAGHTAQAQELRSKHALLIGGLGGDPSYTDKFAGYLLRTRQALVDRFGIPAEHVVVLGERGLEQENFVDGVATSDEIRAQFDRLARDLAPEDHLYIFFFGHGSFDGDHAYLNIPRQDLSDAEYAALIDRVAASRVIVFNTTSASGPFAEALSAPERIIVTATRSGTERNETLFPEFLVTGLTDPAADLDKDGDLSVREIFAYASESTARSFSASGHLATEHALLEDTGDGQAHELDQLDGAGEGALAAVTYLKRRLPAIASSDAPRDAASTGLLQEKETVERAIAELKSRKSRLEEDAYYADLETLFVRLARINEQLGL